MLTPDWCKASKSNPSGSCLEAKFKKAGKSNGNGGNNCVEVSFSTASMSAAAGHCVEVGFTTATKSHSVGQCVEVAFAKSSKSGPFDDRCVEVGMPGEDTAKHPEGCDCDTPVVNGQQYPKGHVLVRDSKDKGDGPVLAFDPQQWQTIIDVVDRVRMGWPNVHYDGQTKYYVLTDPAGTNTVLRYTVGEWDAFVDGVTKGEFDLPDTDA